MTFAPVGSPISATASTFSLTPGGVGNLILVEVVSETAADFATALTSSNVTWSVLVAHTSLTANAVVSTVFIGHVTSTGTATVTVTMNTGSPTLRIAGQEFSTSAGFSTVTLDTSGTVNSATTLFPSLTPAHGSGELYWGFAFNSTTATVGTTSGYTFHVDANGNGMCYDAACANSAQQPVWGASDTLSGIAVLLYEAVTVHSVSASLTVTPAFSATRAHVRPRTASLTVTPSFAAHASSSETPSNAILDEAGDPLLDEAGGFILDESGGTVTHSVSASLTVTPSFSATRVHTDTRSASLTIVPVLSAADAAVHVRSDSLTVTPVLAAAGTSAAPTFNATASLTVTPAFAAAALHTQLRAASLTVTPAFSAAALRSRFRSASLTIVPVLAAAPRGAHVASASLVVTPAFSATRVHGDARSASLTVRPVLTVTVSHGLGAPPGYPDGDLGAMLEFNLGGWTDVTQWAAPDGTLSGTFKSGQPDGAQQPNPAALPVTLDNGDYRFSPRNSAGPYFGQLRQNTPARLSFNSPYGAYLRLEANDSDRAFVADTSALHVTGSLELRTEVCLSDWRPCVLAARWDGTTPSWYLMMNDDATLTFSWFDTGGTQHSGTSTNALPFTSGTFAVACRLDTSAGTFGFYTSDGIDGTFTLLGSSFSVLSGARSVRAGNSALVAGYSSSGIAGQLLGQVRGLRLYNGIGGTVVADAAFYAQLPGVTSWTDAAGLTWTLAGGAELTGRDYRLTGELSSIVPSAAVSGNVARTAVTVSGRLRRLQQGSAPAVMSPMKRAILGQAGSLVPVDYWPMEETQFARTFGPALGAQLLTLGTGNPQAAADSTVEASAPLPVLNNAILSATVDTYTGATTWSVRFLLKVGTLPPPAGNVIASVTLGSGTLRRVDLLAFDDGTIQLKGFNSSGGSVFATGFTGGFDIVNPKWMSIEAFPVSGGFSYNVISLAPGATSGAQFSSPPTVSGSIGNVTSVTLNGDGFFTDTVMGHLTVQKAWTSMFALGKPLNAWRTELAADRFARMCDENGIPCRIAGRPATTQQMGPQPRGSEWTVLRDCANTEQGLLFEPHHACNGVGLRTRESLSSEQPDAVTLDFDASELPGNLSPADDDQGFLNDVTGSMPDGTAWREVLDDGTAKSVSEPEDGGSGRYAGSVPFPVNVADPSMLQANVAFYLGRTSVDEARYRQVAADLGIPGAPAADIARLRPGDRVKLTTVPAAYQDSDVRQLATGATEAFGPGRRITWDCVPASPYDT